VCCCFTRFCTQMSIAEAFGFELSAYSLERVFVILCFVGCTFCNEMNMCYF
jgi:hypothetical protein